MRTVRDQGAIRGVNVPPALCVPLLLVLSILAGCSPREQPSPELTTAYRHVGTWSGTGNKTIGDVMLASGRFRVTWRTSAQDSPDAGHFKLTARSSVSGRPLQEVADHRGEGSGSIEFAEEDRRVYDFTVESERVEWSFTVDDVIAVPK